PRIGARLNANLRAFAHDEAVQEFDLGAPALGHILTHRRALIGRAAPDPRQPALVVNLERDKVALAGTGDRLGRQMVDLFELVAARLTDADRLAAEPRLEMADRLVLRNLRAWEAGAGRDPVRHRVGDELRPALAPEIVGDLGDVGMGDEPADLVR